METVNEGSTCYVTASPLNKSGIAESPVSATWEAIDLKTGTVLQAETSLTPASSMEIIVPASVNRILDAAMTEEIRRITVKATYGADDKATGQFDYRVLNLSRVS